MDSAWFPDGGVPSTVVLRFSTRFQAASPEGAGNVLGGWDFVNGDADLWYDTGTALWRT